MSAPEKSKKTRAEINRENAQKSTGPKTEEGKAKSSQNRFKHGVYSKQVIAPGEDPAELDELRAKLRDEHQPANTTEEILVDELAQHYWRMRRIRCQEVGPWRKGFEGPPDYPKIEFFARALASAERSFHKTLTALQKLQKDRGFVPQKTVPAQAAAAVAAPAPLPEDAIKQAHRPRATAPYSKELAGSGAGDAVPCARIAKKVLECLFSPDAPNGKQNSGSVPQILANPDIKAALKRLAADQN